MSAQRGLLAVADADHILCEDGTRYAAAVRTMPHVSDLAAKCLARGIGSLWIMESAGAPAITSEWTADLAGWNIFRPAPDDRRPPACLEIRRDGPREGERIRHAQVHWLDRASEWDWRRETSASAVLDATCTYRRMMGRLPAFSPSYIGRDMLVSGMRPDWLAFDVDDAFLDPADPVGWPAGHQLMWLRRQYDWEPCRYLHKIDGNAAWLAIAAGQGFGAGSPVRVNASPTAGGYGIWRIRATPDGSPYRGRELPSPWVVIEEEADEHFDGWVWTPTVKHFELVGWEVQIEGGWVWQEKHMAMRQWALDMWERKQRCPAGSALDAIKHTYASTITTLQYEGRPDWHPWILAESVRRQLAFIEKIRQQTGRTPIAAYSDALIYASDSPQGDALWYERADKLGGYKAAGTVAGGAAIHELQEAARDGMAAAEWMGKFNRAARGV